MDIEVMNKMDVVWDHFRAKVRHRPNGHVEILFPSTSSYEAFCHEVTDGADIPEASQDEASDSAS